jgi:putative acetyltransferase
MEQHDNPAVKIRPIRLEDAEQVNELRRHPAVMSYTMSLPSERISENQKRIESFGENDHIFVAEVNGRVVGVVGLHVGSGKERHVGAIGIMVHGDFQGQSIGRALMETVLDLADNYLMLVRTWLIVLAENHKAIHLYESLGFKIEGTLSKSIIVGGQYVDSHFMARLR